VRRPVCLQSRHQLIPSARKDKTLVEILDRIKSLEGKLDSLSLRGAFPTVPLSAPPPPALVAEPLPMAASEAIASLPLAALTAPLTASPTPMMAGPYQYISSTNQMLAWPVIQQLLEPLIPKQSGLDLTSVEQSGPAIVLGLHQQDSKLPAEPAGPIILTDYVGSDQLGMSNSTPVGGITVGTTALTWDAMQRLSKAYFDTFNFLYPILDRQAFITGVLASVFNDGFDDSISSTLAFLVFALGEAALGGLQGLPVGINHGRPSGVKGGTITHPPGLALFNEARKRLGFSLTECSLETVQVFALAG
jgi:hypothetical protein